MSSFFDRNVIFAIERTQRSLRRRVESDLATLGSGVTVPQSMLLAVIDENPGLSQRDAAAFLLTDVMNVSRMVRELAARGLVARERDADDLRAYRVVLTELGAATLTEARKQMLRSRRELAARLGQDERDQLLALLTEVEAWCENRPVATEDDETAPRAVVPANRRPDQG